MTRIDIFSGFLGAGKTTFIKKLIADGYNKYKVVLIENEFGEIGIDGGFLKDSGIEVREINSGCICCSLTGDFKEALRKVKENYNPDRIIIEPSGVGKLSEVAAAVAAAGEDFELGGLTTVVDCKKAKMYIKNFGEFFNDQVATANCVALSRVQMCDPKLVEDVVGLIKMLNDKAVVLTAPWDELTGDQILEVIDGDYSISSELEALIKEHLEEEEHEHHHHHDEDDDEEECSCGCGHHHHHGHDADDVFTSWGKETAKSFTEEEIKTILQTLTDEEKFGMVVRAKGIVSCTDGGWIHFDYTPGEWEVRKGSAAPTGLVCVIGAEIKTDVISELFGIK